MSTTTKKKAYQQKAEAKLAEHKAELDKARAKVKGAAADARLDAQEDLDALESKYEAAKKKLAELKDAGEDAWEDFTKGLDEAWDDISGSVKKVLARFK